MKNPTFEKALALIAHPFSLSMLALMLINDGILRPLWPSWWTGKLSDIAWLGFVPFVLLALLAWIPQLREPHRQSWVRWLAFGLAGIGFTLAKTLPGFHAMTVHGFELLTGTPTALVRDPSDLLALPVLFIGWRLWNRDFSPPRLARHARITLLPAACLLLLADAAAPDYGINCLTVQGGIIYANSTFSHFNSSDGGITWLGSPQISDFHCPDFYANTQTGTWQELEAVSTHLRLRYQSGQPIQTSSDDGTSWQTVYQPERVSEALEAYRLKTSMGSPVFLPGPLDAVEEPQTGNIVFAMGYEGVLIRTSAGEWLPVPVGSYQPLPVVPDFKVLQVLLGDQLLLSLLAGLLIYVILAVPRLKLSKKWMPVILWIMVIGAAVAWLVVVLIFPPGSYGYTYALVGMGILAAAVLLLILTLALSVDLFRTWGERPVMLKMALWSLGGAGLFFLPSLLWAFNFLPSAGWVVALSLLMVVGITIAAFLKLPRSRSTA